MLGRGDKAHELFSMLNPVNHAATRSSMSRYRVEPYVAVADVYSEPPHIGRGGWSWYTGSSGWLYRAGLEHILGLTVRAETLHLDPCIPRTWEGFTASYRHGETIYEIQVENPDGCERGVAWVEMDGQRLPDGVIPLEQGVVKHQVVVRMGNPEPPLMQPLEEEQKQR
jgi:cyclic beta-1,2-glucan synthetase